LNFYLHSKIKIRQQIYSLKIFSEYKIDSNLKKKIQNHHKILFKWHKNNLLENNMFLIVNKLMHRYAYLKITESNILMNLFL